MPAAAAAEADWRALESAGVRPCGLGARDTLRLEAGMNLYGQDMDERVEPARIGARLDGRSCQPPRLRRQGGARRLRPARQQVGLMLEGAGGVLRAHQKVHTSRGDGETTSGTFSPTLGRSIALARVPQGVAVGEGSKWKCATGALPARVVKPPFVRNGRALV